MFPGPLGDVGPNLDALERLVASYQIEVTVHVVPAAARELHARYGARSPRLFLIRPDGHIGYIGSPGQITLFAAYLDRWFHRR